MKGENVGRWEREKVRKEEGEKAPYSGGSHFSTFSLSHVPTLPAAVAARSIDAWLCV